MAWSDAARAAALEARRLHPKAKKSSTKGHSSLKGHPQFSSVDYKRLKAKGYSDAEIKKIWDADQSRGAPPQQHSVNFKRPASYDHSLERMVSRRLPPLRDPKRNFYIDNAPRDNGPRLTPLRFRSKKG